MRRLVETVEELESAGAEARGAEYSMSELKVRPPSEATSQRRFHALGGGERAQVGVNVALEGVDGVADYYAVNVGHVYAPVGGGVFENLSFEAGVAYGFRELFAGAEQSGDVLDAHAAF